MTSQPPLSEIIRTLEQIAGRSCDLLSQALDLVQQAAASERVIVETAEKAVGAERSATVVDLVRMPVAERIAQTLEAIGSEIGTMLPSGSGVRHPSPAASDAADRVAAASRRPPEPRLELYGIEIPSGRKADADEVVAAARSAAAQNKKTNPFEHHRGKNSWKKSLFVAALAGLVSDERARQPVPGDGATATQAVPPPAPRTEAQPVPDVSHQRQEPRPSVARHGPLRGSPAAIQPASAPPHSAPMAGSFPAASGRPHGQGVAVQKISDEQMIDGTPSSTRPRNPFFTRTGR